MSLQRRSFLVVNDSFFPGWQATIDGHTTRIYRTNGLVRGVVVPAGEPRRGVSLSPGLLASRRSNFAREPARRRRPSRRFTSASITARSRREIESFTAMPGAPSASSRGTRVDSAALCLLVLTSGIYYFSPPVADNDLWGHLAFGREMLHSRSLPALNRYSYTEPMHPWINHEFAAECLFAFVYDRFGAPALLALKVAAGLATLGIVAWTVRLRTRAVIASSLALVATASMMSFGYMIRPQIFTFLALALLWNRLQACAAGAERQRLWLLPPLFVLWINAHGGAVAGIAVLLLFTAVTIAERVPVPRGVLVATSFASMAALLFNPYGIHLPLFLVEDLRRVRPISEWAPIGLFDGSNLHFKLAIAVLLVGAAVRPGCRIWELAICGMRRPRDVPPSTALAFVRHPGGSGDCRSRSTSCIGQLLRRMPPLRLSAAGAGVIAAAAGVLSIYQIATVIDVYGSLRGQIFVATESVSGVRRAIHPRPRAPWQPRSAVRLGRVRDLAPLSSISCQCRWTVFHGLFRCAPSVWVCVSRRCRRLGSCSPRRRPHSRLSK